MAPRTLRSISRFVSAAAVSVALGLSLYPSIARAYNARTDVVLDRLSDETFDAMKRRAEVVARAAAQRSFDRDVLISDVSVNILARHNGTEMPLMTLGVSRLNWQNRPDVRRWATYYRSSQALLQLPSQGDLPIPNAGGGGFTPFSSAPAPDVTSPVPAPAPSAAPLPIDTPGSPQASPAVPQASPAASPKATKDASKKPKLPKTSAPNKRKEAPVR